MISMFMGTTNGDDGNRAFPRAARPTRALTVVVGEDELAEIARAGYAEAAPVCAG
jgi:hypothetical protein